MILACFGACLVIPIPYTFLNKFEAVDKVATYTIKEQLLLVAFFNKSTFLNFLRK